MPDQKSLLLRTSSARRRTRRIFADAGSEGGQERHTCINWQYKYTLSYMSIIFATTKTAIGRKWAYFRACAPRRWINCPAAEAL